MTNTTIPGGPAEVTADWLGSVLRTGGHAVDVDEVQIGAIGTGQTGATYRVGVTYRSNPENLPPTFVVKLPSQEPEVRARASFGYRAEHAFYTEVADSVRIPMPQCYHCAIGADGSDFVLLLSDMAPAEQGDQIAGCSAVDAELGARALAGLHGPRWSDPAWLNFTGAVMPKPDEAAAGGLGDIVRTATDITLQRLGAQMSAEDRATLEEVAALIAPWLLLEPDRFSVLHGDFRLDNLLFDPAHTRVSVVDWQTLAVGLPARDLAYFVASSLEPGLRARTERDLVACYHGELLRHGVSDYDLATCWNDYRLGMLQVPLITTLATAFVESTARGDEVMLTMIRRSCQAIRELDTCALIRAAASIS